MTELNIVNFIIQATYITSTQVGKNYKYFCGENGGGGVYRGKFFRTYAYKL